MSGHALPSIYEELYNLLIVDTDLMEWLRAIWPVSADPEAQYNLVRIWNGRAPKGYEPRLLSIGESRDDDDERARSLEADGYVSMVRLHLFTEKDGAFYSGSVGVQHLCRILNDAPMILDGYTLIDGMVRLVTAQEDPGSATYHTIAEYRGMVAAV